VLRIAHRRGICAGGTKDGAACAGDLDCEGGRCGDACNGGTSDGLACEDDGDCPSGGRCGVQSMRETHGPAEVRPVEFRV
jgi:hypothetical protein